MRTKIKSNIRACKPLTKEKLHDASLDALESIPESDAKGFFDRDGMSTIRGLYLRIAVASNIRARNHPPDNPSQQFTARAHLTSEVELLHVNVNGVLRNSKCAGDLLLA